MDTTEHLHLTLWAYTLEHRGPDFVHQHAVDAFGAQHADAHTRPIELTFALVGLYLHVERGYTGREVQRVHAALARRRPAWPSFVLPAFRGEVTTAEVLAAPAGPERDAAIDAWCAAVWAAYGDCRDAVVELLHRSGVVAVAGDARRD
ncbi:MAG TPA: DUF5946 family protein [Gemmatimonadaceae bacterium]